MTDNNINEQNVFFSMIVPIYNCEHFLSRCIKSVLTQDYKNFELILVNDGSIDKSLKICEEYKLLDNRIVIINKNKNSGVSDTRNAGLRIARGKYICFLDADDYIGQGYFSEIIKILEKYSNIDLINFGMYSDVENKSNKILSTDVINYNEKIYQSKNEIKSDFVSLWDNTMLYNVVNKVYKKSIIDCYTIEFPNDFFGEDIKFNRLYLDNIDSMYNSKKCFYHYIREREGAVTTKYKEEFFSIRKKEFLEFNEYFEQWGISKEDYYEYSCRRFIERVLGCIENVYYSKLNFKERYNEIKKIIDDPFTKETLKYSKPKSIKVKFMLIPLRLNVTIITMLMGRVLKIVRVKMPSLFNKLKNNR